MPDTTPKQTPPSKEKSGGNGHGTKTPTGPSPHVRENYIKKVREITRNTPQPSTKKPS